MSNLDVISILGQMAESSADPRIRAITKALTSTQAGTNIASLTGGGAMRVEALEPELATATVSNPHFILFNKLFADRHNSFSLLDQVVVQDGIGGYPGSSISNETGSNQTDRNGSYKRVVTELKVMSEFAGVTLPTALQGVLQQNAGVADFSASEQEIFSALSRILQSWEWQALYGNATLNNLEFDGIITNLAANSPWILDMNGAALNSGTQISALAAKISGFGAWGSPDSLLCSPGVKADFDNHLESSYRVNLDNNVASTTLGTLVKGVRYNGLGVGQGIMNLEPHVFMDEALKAPVGSYADAASVTGLAPATLTAAKTAAEPGSKWLLAQAGAYYYCVEAVYPGNVSQPIVLASAVSVVAAGDKIALTIGRSSGAQELYYNVYRGRLGGTNAIGDMRKIGSIAVAGATTVYNDINLTTPGCSEALILTSAPQAKALRLLQMVPPTKIPLAMTTLQYRFAVLYISALRHALPKKHALVKNILPSGATWKPYV